MNPSEASQEAAVANRVVLVAGGTGGLGRAVTLAFLEAGARVAVFLCGDSAKLIHGAAVPAF
jgi:NAD(P)-dependent dehydrogenase (short-subunit alcohol dehydrogenase family)